MSRYNRRRVLQKTYYIFRLIGKPMKMYIRNTPTNANITNVPTDLFAAYEEPVETAGEFTVHGFYGAFEEKDVENRGEGGRYRQVMGTVTVPFAYRSLLDQADYIDPYNDGSRFTKVGACFVDQERLMIYQDIQATVLNNPSDISS